MSDRYVFDAEAIVAFLYGEPGHEAVASLLDDAFDGDAVSYLTETNASEVFYLVARFEGGDGEPTPESLRVADQDVRAVERRGLRVERADWRVAGEVKAHGGSPWPMPTPSPWRTNATQRSLSAATMTSTTSPWTSTSGSSAPTASDVV